MFFESMGSTDPSTSGVSCEISGAGLVPTLQVSPQNNETDLMERKTKNHIVCCVLSFLIKKFEVRVMGVSLFRFFPEIARFPNQSQFDS